MRKRILAISLAVLCSVPMDMGAKMKNLDIVVTESNVVVEQETESVRLYAENVKSSFYGKDFHGKRTASGKIFDKNTLTCAHNKLPFGTILKVTNQENGKTVLVEVTDRGGFTKMKREIDLSEKAFKTIADPKKGLIKVKIEILEDLIL